MAYRTYVGTTGKKAYQLLGNNESSDDLFEELIRQGIEIDDDGCFGFENKCIIKELQPIIEAMEKYINEKDDFFKGLNKDIYNLRKQEITDLTFTMMELQENAYIFVTANLINYLKENIEQEYDIERKKFIYKIKDGKQIWFSAY